MQHLLCAVCLSPCGLELNLQQCLLTPVSSPHRSLIVSLTYTRACRHRQSIINSLQDTDISIRRRSLDLLFAMCNKGNVREIVAELLTYLQASPCIPQAHGAVLREGVLPRNDSID